MDNLIIPHQETTSLILKSSFEVMNELGTGFLESVYRKALLITLHEKGIEAKSEQPCPVYFKKQKIGLFMADLIVEESVIIELKCCKFLLSEHQAQLINYLKATNLSVGLLINFGNRKVEYKRLHSIKPQ